MSFKETSGEMHNALHEASTISGQSAETGSRPYAGRGEHMVAKLGIRRWGIAGPIAVAVAFTFAVLLFAPAARSPLLG